MALIIKRFKTALKGRKEYPNKNKAKGKRSCFKCGKTGHFIANCPDNSSDQEQGKGDKKEKKRSYRKAKGEAHIGKEWDSDCSSSDSDDEGLAASAFNKSSLFPNEHHTGIPRVVHHGHDAAHGTAHGGAPYSIEQLTCN